ncbi:MAG TPA: hypothetical protein VLR92_03905, partial [Blastocatellia bacterium]|nr:hypothetical protein [Blastocatellia bacterium]
MIHQTTSQLTEATPLRPEQRGPSLKSFALYVLVFFIIWSLRATVFISVDEAIESSVWKNVYSNAIKFIIWVVPVFVTLVLLRQRP